MAYQLLWTCIERYASLRYGFDGKIRNKIDNLAENENEFQEGLQSVISDERNGHELYRTDKPGGRTYRLNRDRPKESIHYYYQVRNNVSHRGKSSLPDFQILENSREELYRIFTDYVLLGGFSE